jgi:hypothetical protein
MKSLRPRALRLAALCLAIVAAAAPAAARTANGGAAHGGAAHGGAAHGGTAHSGTAHTGTASWRVHTVLRISVSTGATIGRIRLPRGTFFSDVAAIAAHRRLYIAAAGVKSGGADVREYTAGSGRLIASTGRHPPPSAGGANLTAVPGGVWASFRTGMLGQTVLLRRNGLTSVPLSGSIFGWPMNASTVYGAARYGWPTAATPSAASRRTRGWSGTSGHWLSWA